ncbi:MAG: P-II family nitrogen regulator [Nitrosopumilus sp.]|nr:P-II family nitrogen regulator [Nitrosopumilus sp.]MDF2423165.1 P-II family nitrogen regulator [Nitrosopumilus sp.]MDF2424121.1 P-II family nitrogen regulator [Nitrosopumilus sp.]MDF2426006.1 P-II family nitrogen regulator [Nitrosopumilus sp.]MDF2427524.1 P-II family nitrogen regulator [Nitrosopumilus sp.]
MIKIEAIVRSSAFYDIQNALNEIGIPTYSAYQVQITGIHKSHQGWRNKTSDFLPKAKIEILCADEDEERILDTIQKTASSGEKGDGIVYSYHIGKLVKIRDGKTGTFAL